MKLEKLKNESKLDDLAGGSQAGVEEKNQNPLVRMARLLALSNWYVRRSRDRFWSSEASDDKQDAYWTLYECLLELSKLIAPFVPFLAETLC